MNERIFKPYCIVIAPKITRWHPPSMYETHMARTNVCNMNAYITIDPILWLYSHSHVPHILEVLNNGRPGGGMADKIQLEAVHKSAALRYVCISMTQNGVCECEHVCNLIEMHFQFTISMHKNVLSILIYGAAAKGKRLLRISAKWIAVVMLRPPQVEWY